MIVGYDRNRRAREANEIRAGVRMPPYERIVPAPHRNREHRRNYRLEAREYRNARERGWEPNLMDEEIREAIAEAFRARHARHGEMHENARRAARGEDLFDEARRDEARDAEEMWDLRHQNYAGRFDEFNVDSVEAEEMEAAAAVADLPVLAPAKKVKFED